GDYDLAVARAAEEAGPTALVVSDTSWDGYTDVPRWVAEGYSTIFAEIDLALAAPPATVVIPVGVGALAAAAIVHYRLTHQDAATVLAGVEPRGADCVLQSVLAGHRVTVAGPHLSMMVGL